MTIHKAYKHLRDIKNSTELLKSTDYCSQLIEVLEYITSKLIEDAIDELESEYDDGVDK